LRIDSNIGTGPRDVGPPRAPAPVAPSAPLPPSTWRLDTRHLLYPIHREPERVTLYTRAGAVNTLSDRRQGALVDEWA